MTRLEYLFQNWHVSNQWRKCGIATNGAPCITLCGLGRLHAKVSRPMLFSLKHFGRWGLLFYLLFLWKEPGFRSKSGTLLITNDGWRQL